VSFQAFNHSNVSSLSLLHACRLYGLDQAKESTKRYERHATPIHPWKNPTFFGRSTPEVLQQQYEAAQTALGRTLNHINQIKLFCHVLGSDIDLVAPNSNLYNSKNKILDMAWLLDALPSVTLVANTFRELNEEVSQQNRISKLIQATSFPIHDEQQMVNAIKKHSQYFDFAPSYMYGFPSRDTALSVLKLMIYAKANRREKELTESVKTVLGSKLELIKAMEAFEQPLVCLNPSAIQ
jgi:hypothetical protein